MTRLWRRKRWQLGNHDGFTLIELMIVVAIIGILAAIAIPLYANMQQKTRIGRAQADLRALMSAISMYAVHMGSNPATLGDLNAAVVNSMGQTAGPFLAATPTPPDGWSPTYGYTDNGNGTFTLTATGDGTTLIMP